MDAAKINTREAMAWVRKYLIAASVKEKFKL
jgi:hypothetical protein